MQLILVRYIVSVTHIVIYPNAWPYLKSNAVFEYNSKITTQYENCIANNIL